MGIYWWSAVYKSDCRDSRGRFGPGSERPPGQGNGNPLSVAWEIQDKRSLEPKRSVMEARHD